MDLLGSSWPAISFCCLCMKFLVVMAVFLGPAGTVYFFSDCNFEWNTFIITLLPVYGVCVFLHQTSVSKFMLIHPISSIFFFLFCSGFFLIISCVLSKKNPNTFHCFRQREVACLCLDFQILVLKPVLKLLWEIVFRKTALLTWFKTTSVYTLHMLTVIAFSLSEMVQWSMPANRGSNSVQVMLLSPLRIGMYAEIAMPMRL